MSGSGLRGFKTRRTLSDAANQQKKSVDVYPVKNFTLSTVNIASTDNVRPCVLASVHVCFIRSLIIQRRGYVTGLPYGIHELSLSLSPDVLSRIKSPLVWTDALVASMEE